MDPLVTLRNNHNGQISSLSIVREPQTNISHVSQFNHSENVNNNHGNSNDMDYPKDFHLDLSEFECANLISSLSRTQLLRENQSIKQQDLIRLGANIDNPSTLSRLELNAASISLSGAILASCDVNGGAYLWNLSSRRVIADFSVPLSNNGTSKNKESQSPSHEPGLAIRRIDDSNEFMYHTRGTQGLVSIYDIDRCTGTNTLNSSDRIISTYETKSRTFCSAAPCINDKNLLILPSRQETFFSIWDKRINPSTESNSAFSNIHGVYGPNHGFENDRKYGMITSLAMIHSPTEYTNPIAVSGMESGDLFYHDLAATHIPTKAKINETSNYNHCSIKLSKDPVLSIHLASSSVKSSKSMTSKNNKLTSILTVAGCAGDADDINALPQKDQGTISIIKTIVPTSSLPSSNSFIALEKKTYSNVTPTSESTLSTILNQSTARNMDKDSSHPTKITARLRARLGTCQIGENAPGGKPGVNICRFRNDGKIIAVGGWDKRTRIFSRDGKKALAILKGHTGSVTALDWAENSSSNGLFATGSNDGNICLWRIFPSN